MTSQSARVAQWRIRLGNWAQAERLSRQEDKVILLLTLVIGAIVGLVVVAFILVTERLGGRLYPADGAAWRRLLFLTAGALVTGFLLTRYFPNARGSGIPQTKVALFLRNGRILFRTVFGKFGLSSVSLASGIALGREGPCRSPSSSCCWRCAVDSYGCLAAPCGCSLPWAACW